MRTRKPRKRLRIMVTIQKPPNRVIEPSVDQLKRAIASNQCCYCIDPRTFKSLSAHWIMAHGLNLQDIRDQLGVPKKTAFISDELRAQFIERGKRLYEPKNLHPKGQARHLSKYGVETNRRKLVKARAAMVRLGKRDIPRTCEVCGGIFYNPQGNRLKSCPKPTCRSTIRRQRNIAYGR